MPGCCEPHEYDARFGAGFARRQAKRYRRRGLDATARHIVDAVVRGGVRDATVLEIGGGVGEITVELLRQGARRATTVELSAAYDEEAARLLADTGLGDRVQRRIVDIATEPDAVEPADVVVLHRVVCCYPDYARLLGAVADHTRRQVVFSHPPRNVVSRFMIGAENLTYRLRGSDFRVFAHPPRAMRATLAEHGLTPSVAHPGRAWQVSAARR